MVRAKKHLGQHFLNDEGVAEKIATGLRSGSYDKILEIGPGMGILTKYLLQRDEELFVVELDRESVEYLNEHFPALKNNIIPADFLQLPLPEIFKGQIAIIGNFPYNISTQIVFKVLENKEMIPEFSGMFQKEVAERIVANEGSKTYGILSVLTALYYERQYLFTVEPEKFNPPPKVRSGVIRLSRKENLQINCDEILLKRVVKTAFNQRRKTLRNALKSLNLDLSAIDDNILAKRAEQISPADYIIITAKLQVP